MIQFKGAMAKNATTLLINGCFLSCLGTSFLNATQSVVLVIDLRRYSFFVQTFFGLRFPERQKYRQY